MILSSDPARSQANTRDDPAQQTLLHEAHSRLTDIGYQTTKLPSLFVPTTSELEQLLAQQQTLILRPAALTSYLGLSRALGVTYQETQHLRHQTDNRTPNNIAAIYSPQMNSIAIASKKLFDEADPKRKLQMLCHELVHSYQFQTSSKLQSILEAETNTFDESIALLMLLEGEAQVIASKASGLPLDLSYREKTWNLIDLGFLHSQIYEAGHALVLHIYNNGDEKPIDRMLERENLSTEQILHPKKNNKDFPGKLKMPKFPDLELSAVTTIGELGILSIAHELGLDDTDARIASTGWDGDMLELWTEQGSTSDQQNSILMWATIWDRRVDADQFYSFLDARKIMGWRHSNIARRGALIVLTLANEQETLDHAISKIPDISYQDEFPEFDSDTTEDAEVALQGTRPATHSWNHESLGLRIPFGEEWFLTQRNATDYLFLEQSISEGFAVNVNVRSSDDGPYSLPELTTIMRSLPSRAGVEPIAITERSVEGMPLIRLDYECLTVFASQPLRFVVLGYAKDRAAVFVTVTLLKNQWSRHKNDVEILIKNIQFSRTHP